MQPAGAADLLEFLRGQPGWFQSVSGKKQLAILFALIESARMQPTQGIERLLVEAENRSVASVTVARRGSGYTGRVPRVTVAPPLAAVPEARPRAPEVARTRGARPSVCVHAVLRRAVTWCYTSLPPWPLYTNQVAETDVLLRVGTKPSITQLAAPNAITPIAVAQKIGSALCSGT